MAQVLGPIQIGISNLIDSRLNESHQFSITDIEYFTVKWINLFYKCTKLRHIYIYSYRHNLIGFERMMKKIKEQKYKSVSDCHCHSLSRHNRVQKNCTGLIESVISTLSHNELDTDCLEVLLACFIDGSTMQTICARFGSPIRHVNWLACNMVVASLGTSGHKSLLTTSLLSLGA